MMTDRELMQQAFDAMSYGNTDEREAARLALRSRLAQQEPVQFKCTVIDDAHPDGIPLEKWTSPPQRTERTEQNFCPRCGKRTKDIHTCTPPQEKETQCISPTTTP